MEKPKSGNDRDSHLLFLSHASADTETAQALVARIESTPEARKHGLKVWIDKRDLKAGEGWQVQLEQALERDSTAFAVYVGSGGVINWVDSEVRVALSRARNDPEYPFIPILSKQCSGSDALPAFVRQYQGVKDVENNTEEFAKLIRAVTRQEGFSRVQFVDEPFLGLRAFEEKDTHLFFGRDEAADELIERLKRSRLLMVAGDSGAGKSSLVKAGLVPRYRGGVLSERRDQRSEAIVWHVVETRPGSSNPFDFLANRVAVGARDIGRSQDDIRALRKMVREQDPQVVTDALLDGAPKNARILVVVDQFEELFTLSSKTSRGPYIEMLLYLVKYNSPAEFRVVLTMRRDYYNLCHEYSDLYTWLEDRNRGAKYSVRRMSDVQLRACIEKPLSLTDAGPTDVFVDRVLADVGDQPGDLAMLEMALTECWRRRGEYNGDMLQAYTSIGGTAGALANIADEVFDRLSNDEQALAEASFIRLVRLGETGGTTRRMASRNEFSEGAWQVMQKLATEEYGRLIHISGVSHPERGAAGIEKGKFDDVAESISRSLIEPNSQEAAETVELSHEALVSQWPRYQGWLQASPDRKRIHDGLIVSAKLWATLTTKRSDELLTGNRLAEAIVLLDRHPLWLSEQERAFIGTSRTRARIRRLVEKGTVALLALLTVIAVWFGYNANIEKGRALKAERDAIRERSRAEAEKEKAQEAKELADKRADEAQTARKEAEKQRKETLRHQSLYFADRSRRQTALGNATNGIHLSLKALPFDLKKPDRPYVSQAEVALYHAVNSYRMKLVLHGHEDAIRYGAFSSDGCHIVTASNDNTARLWDAATGEELANLQGHEKTVYCAVFSPNKKLILTASVDGTARLWDVETGKTVAVLRGHEGPVFHAAFNPDGSRIVTASADGTAGLWDTKTGELVAFMQPNDRPKLVWQADFSPDGRYIITVLQYGPAQLWDAANGENLAILKGHDNRISHASFSPDSRFVITASEDKTARIWETKTGKQLTVLKGHYAALRYAAFDPEGQKVVTTAWNWPQERDGTARLWDARTGRQLSILRHENNVWHASFSPDGLQLATASGDGTAYLWDAETGQLLAVLKGHNDSVRHTAFSPDDLQVLTTSQDGTARLWKAKINQPIAILKGHDGPVFHAAFNPDGSRIVTASADGTARLWDVETGDPITVLQGHTAKVEYAQFSSNSLRVVTASWDFTARVWDAETGHQIAVLRHDAEVLNAMFTPDGRQVVTNSWDGTTRLWDAEKEKLLRFGYSLQASQNDYGSVELRPAERGEPLADIASRGKDDVPDRSYTVSNGLHIVSASDRTAWIFLAESHRPIARLRGHEARIRSVNLSPYSRYVVTTSDDQTARLWGIQGQELVVLRGHKGIVRHAAFSPVHHRLITASDDHTARLWDIETGQTLAVFNGHKDSVRHAAFDPNGFKVVTVSDDGTARLWRVLPAGKKLIDLARRMIPHELSPEDLRRLLYATD
jgi:WD40 repeat protein